MTNVAYKGATTTPVPEIAAELQDLLGQRLVAYGANVRSPKLVGRWAAGSDPRDETAKRLRELYRVVLVLRNQGHGPGTIRAFVNSANPDLGDRAPIDAIRDGLGVDAVHAAEAFGD